MISPILDINANSTDAATEHSSLIYEGLASFHWHLKVYLITGLHQAQWRKNGSLDRVLTQHWREHTS